MLPTITFSDSASARLDDILYWHIVYTDGSSSGDQTNTGEIKDISRANTIYDSPVVKGDINPGWFTLSLTAGSESAKVTKIIKPPFCKTITLYGTYTDTYNFIVEVATILPLTDIDTSKCYYVDGKMYAYIKSKWVELTTKEGETYITGQAFVANVTSGVENINFNFHDSNKVYLDPSMMIITYAHSSVEESPEIMSHRVTDDKEKVDSNKLLLPTFKIGSFSFYEHYLQINGSNFNISKHDYLDKNKQFINNLKVENIPEFQSMAMTKAFQKFYIGAYCSS